MDTTDAHGSPMVQKNRLPSPRIRLFHGDTVFELRAAAPDARENMDTTDAIGSSLNLAEAKNMIRALQAEYSRELPRRDIGFPCPTPQHMDTPEADGG